MEFRAARRSERDQVLDLLAHWYSDRDFFARYNQNDPTFRDELCLVAADNGRLLATVQIFDRKITLSGQAAPMGGIGSVFTHPEHRHSRLASELMRLAVATMEREGFEVSLLFAERLTFYNQFGWKEVARKFAVLANTAALPFSGDYSIDVLDHHRDLPAVMALHREYSGAIDVTCVRDEADWRANLSFAGNMEADPVGGCEEYFILAQHGGALAAYARAARLHGVSMVMEYGYRRGELDAAVALFRHLGTMAAGGKSLYPLRGDHSCARVLQDGEGRRATVLVSHTQHDPLLESRLVELGCALSQHEDNNYMWRVISPDRLTRRFGMKPGEASKWAFARFEDPRSLFWTSDRF